MKPKVRYLEAAGTPYERGKKSGELFQRSLPAIIPKYRKLLANPRIKETATNIQRRVGKIFPAYLEEVYGRADGAGIDREVYFLLMCAELLGEGTGCTTVIHRNADNTLVLAHNEDDNYSTLNFSITKCITEQGWFVTSDFHTMPFGNGFSWNSHGIAKVVNFCPPPKVDLQSIPRYFIQRHISEAISLDDFSKRCQACSCASGFHALAVDVNTNSAVSIEITTDEVSAMSIENSFIHTNHYIHPGLLQQEQVKDRESTSAFRLETSRRLLQNQMQTKGRITLEDLRAIMRYRGSSFNDSILAVQGDPYLTFATFALDTVHKNKVVIDFHTTGETVNYQYVTRPAKEEAI